MRVNDAAGEREMAPKCGSLPRDAGDLVGLRNLHVMDFDGKVLL